ncbi:MAG: hypothetical protein KJ737_10480 [Proteobacteria bacterium]|nr:hypothetical protein [Pseudomonadota bacterium]
MNRKPTSLPRETWEFFSACIYYLGKSALTSLFQRGERQIERWSADPQTSKSTRNPLDRYEALLTMLVEKNYLNIARSAVSRQAHLVGCEIVPKNWPVPDKLTLEHELIDDIPVKAEFDSVLLDPLSTREECRHALQKIIRELTENYVKKCRNSNWEP